MTFWTTFWGGFAVDADFGDGFSGCIEGPKIVKNHEKSIILHFRQGGGVGPKHSAFCGGCFSINSNRVILGPIKSKNDQKNPEPSTFSIPPIFIKNHQKSIKSDKMRNYRKL
jgi:hypothetical protein